MDGFDSFNLDQSGPLDGPVGLLGTLPELISIKHEAPGPALQDAAFRAEEHLA